MCTYIFTLNKQINKYVYIQHYIFTDIYNNDVNQNQLSIKKIPTTLKYQAIINAMLIMSNMQGVH
jgi:hypothetical protein